MPHRTATRKASVAYLSQAHTHEKLDAGRQIVLKERVSAQMMTNEKTQTRFSLSGVAGQLAAL